MNIIPILFTFDQGLEMPAGVCLTSLLKHAGSETFYDIFILHGPQCDFSKSLLLKLPELYGNCQITFRKVEGEFVGSYKIRGIPETAYYRLISPKLIPEYDKFLYSDIDVIFREDLTSYFSIDLTDNYFGAVSTVSELRPDNQKYLKKYYNYDFKDGYYYSGNLIINAKLQLEDKMLDVFRKLGKNRFHQQDMTIINLACKGRILPLPPSFCLSVEIYDLIHKHRLDMENLFSKKEINHTLATGTIHYNGAKPWKQACPNMDIWWNYYRQSIFFNEQFCHDFWVSQRDSLSRMSLLKRVKQLIRYPIDKREW